MAAGAFIELGIGAACLGYLAWLGIGGRKSSAGLGAESMSGQETEAESKPLTGIERRLRAAGLSLSAGSYGLLLTATFLGLFMLSWLITQRPWISLGLASLCLVGAESMVRARGKSRARRFETRLVDAVDAMVSALTAGQNLTQAVASAAESSREPVRSELAHLSRMWSWGMGTEEGLKRVQERFDGEGTRLFCQTLLAKASAGGEIAPVLGKVNQIIRQRLQLRKQLHSRLAGSQMSGIFVALLPYALIPVYAWQRPEWYELLLTEPDAHRLLLGAFLLQVMGLVWLRRILQLEL